MKQILPIMWTIKSQTILALEFLNFLKKTNFLP